MGDRSNIYLTTRDKEGQLENLLDLYWHWGGDSNEEYARDGLKASQSRWNDDSYGTSMFLESLKGNWPSGIRNNDFDDNEYAVIEVCWSDRKVRKWPYQAHGDRDALNGEPLSIHTFEEFVKAVSQDKTVG